MSVVVPAILTTTRTDLDEKLARLHGLVQRVQIDVVDGIFAAPATWPYAKYEKDISLPHERGLRYEVDLMTRDAEREVGTWLDAGASSVVVHVESVRNLGALFDDIRQRYGHDKDFAPDLVSIGVALNGSTDPAIIEPYLDRIDYVQFMGIEHIGRQGEPFSKKTIERVQDFRKHHPDVLIQIDGGVSRDTAPALLAAGADRLVVGSALWNAENIVEELHAFELIAENYGIFS